MFPRVLGPVPVPLPVPGRWVPTNRRFLRRRRSPRPNPSPPPPPGTRCLPADARASSIRRRRVRTRSRRPKDPRTDPATRAPLRGGGRGGGAGGRGPPRDGGGRRRRRGGGGGVNRGGSRCGGAGPRRRRGFRTGDWVNARAMASHVARSGVLPSYRSNTLTSKARSAFVNRNPVDARGGGFPRQRGFRRPFMNLFFPALPGGWCQKGFERKKHRARPSRSFARTARR